MSDGALILTYHAVEHGPAPLCIAPSLFAQHLEALSAAGARPVTISQLPARIESGAPFGSAVALTFDDAFASVADQAAPLLAERGWPATVFAVSEHLGRHNDWPTQPARAPNLALADRRQLALLAASGWEIGSHGARHEPLDSAGVDEAEAEVVASRQRLEQSLGVHVESFAYPYGVRPSDAALAAVRRSYRAACTGSIGRVGPGTDHHMLPRVDAHYLRSTKLLGAAVRGRLGVYLATRSIARRTRRLLISDFR